jgi:hypothetical protein
VADIHLNLTSLQQLYDSLDPAPFRDKALDRDAEAYLVESAKEFPASAPLRLVVHGPESLRPSLPDVATAVRAHFSLSLVRLAREGRFKRRIGLRALVLGLLVLVVALAAAEGLRHAGTWAGIIVEGLVIIGWVGLWLPAEALLFQWVETSEERAVLRRLSEIPVEFVATGPPASGAART